MSFNQYFQSEMLALRELGKEFTQKNPALAPFLGTPGRDPDVERVLEGFAFLSGRLRQKLDDEIPEFTHSLFSLLWPNYLRPVPACSIIAYQPEDKMSASTTVSRGTIVESVAVQGTRCQFRTVYETEILPVRIAGMRILERNGEASIALSFETLGIPLENIPLKRLRFYLTGEPAIAHTLYFTLANRVKEVRIVLRDEQMEEHVTACLRPKSLQPVGFDEDDGLFPYPANTFPGYRILQEYFFFPEKFLFVELADLEQGINQSILQSFHKATGFEIHFALKELPEFYASFRADNWRLFCTPVVNLFPMDASPLTLNQRQTEYRIVPEPRLPSHYAVYSVDSVGTWGVGNRNDRQYLPFESFGHETDEGGSTAYYRLRISPSHKDDGTETYISFVQTTNNAVIPTTETISFNLTCTNRMLPRELRIGDICIHAGDSPDAVTFSNITPVVPSCAPPLEGDIFWRLLSNMSLNYISLTDVHALRTVLRVYDFRALHDKSHARILDKTMNGIVRIHCSETDRIFNGLPVRGAQIRLVLDERAFICEGAMYLFGSVLNEFFALYATVNSFHQLIIEEASGEEYRWPARLGRTHRI
jgi:type VI secretion system protein ImpG